MIFTTKTIPQIWRFFTAFFITKPKFAILLDPYFCRRCEPTPSSAKADQSLVYQYGSGLETESTRFSQPGDFFVYTMFVGSVIVVSPIVSYVSISLPQNHLGLSARPAYCL